MRLTVCQDLDRVEFSKVIFLAGIEAHRNYILCYTQLLYLHVGWIGDVLLRCLGMAGGLACTDTRSKTLADCRFHTN